MKNKGGCLGCKHFYIEPGYHYSEWTSEEFSAVCNKAVFRDLSGEEGNIWYKVIFVEGLVCKKYGQAGHVE